VSETPRDEKEWEDILARRYREAADEQPSAGLDEAILAAARRAAGARPHVAGEAPGPRGRFRASRWNAPLAAAAVIVLAVALTLMLEREPEVMDLGESARQQPALPAPAETPAPPLAEAGKEALSAPSPAAREPGVAAMAKRSDQGASAETPRMQSSGAPMPSSEAANGAALADALTASRESLAKAEPAPDAATAPRALQRSAPAEAPSETVPAPRQRLRDVEALYEQGQTDAADRALDGFCRDFPGYRLPETLVQHALRLGLTCGREG
jgi:hypothetical protein